MGRTAPRQAAKGAKNDDSSRLKIKEMSASLDEWPSALWSVLGIVTCQKGSPGDLLSKRSKIGIRSPDSRDLTLYFSFISNLGAMMISTRRFWSRPSLVSLLARG